MSDECEAVRIECKIVHKDGKFPFRKQRTDAGYDVYSVEDAELKPGSVVSLRTGIIVACPPGYYITVEGRSGLGMAGIMPFRSIIDSTYCGELMVVLTYLNQNHCSQVPFMRHMGQYSPHEIKKGDRIAQIVLNKQYDMLYQEVAEFGPDYDQRGTDGWGSSGN